ncbi:probable cysteine--tRNA ligase, mitochondrial isoform X2 [Diachasma alloeum]|nr:probable cysteine--tRNA ligase, mitochondrial isoform X2 [Diachasma alloeum]
MKLNFEPMKIWSRLFHQEMKQQWNTVWSRPVGYETGIFVYNPIVKKKVPLILKNHKTATWYVCGPTVYDSAHIGHACSYIRFDIIRRILSSFFLISVLPVMGITDIDDKIILHSQGSSKFSSWRHLSKHYEQEFFSEMRQLNILPSYVYCRVTDYIPEIINFISTLITKDFAYKSTDNSIYFNASKYPAYGKLRKPDENMTSSLKLSPWDFALWKAAKPNEPFWDSPWGPGRPGWHIECSTMASVTLGNNIDIHSGGLDLIFPHHENEEAQSCCHHETGQWVNYWLHSGLLHLEDTKMSKSLQNTITIKELLEKFTANQFRLLCLCTHYRSTIEFSQETMSKAVALLKKFEYFQSDCRNYVAGRFPVANVDSSTIYGKLRQVQENILEALRNDFGTPQVVDELSELVRVVNKGLNSPIQGSECFEVRDAPCIAAAAIYVERVLRDLGICMGEESLQAGESDGKFRNVVDDFVKFRTIVRNKALEMRVKDKELLGACDDVRKSLANCGVKVKDYRNTATWTFIEE